MSPPLKQTPGWRSWKPASAAHRRNPTNKVPQIKWSRPALQDVARLHAFLCPKSPDAALRAIRTIRQGVKALGKHPAIGRPLDELPPEFREWVIELGQAAYIALYRYDGKHVVILAVRHSREAGYGD